MTQWQQISAQCIDEKGNNVDWIAMYKLPRHSEVSRHSKSYIDEGK